MTYKEIYYFTGQCLSLDEHTGFRRTIVKKIQNEDINWEDFVQLCSDHLVIPAIYLRFKAHGILNILPEELTRILTEIYQANRVRNAQILLQIDHLTAALHPLLIYPVFLKGTANLLDGLYSDLGQRMIQDIDFLVIEEDYLRTADLLESMGYSHHQTNYMDYKDLKHYPRLYKYGEPAVVEIHRLPVTEKYTDQFNSAMIFRDKKAIAGKPGIYVPSDRHKLIQTFIHSQLAHKGHVYKQSSFRGFNDLYMLSKRIPVFTLSGLTRHGKKAISWLVFGQRVLGLPGLFYPFETRGAKWFCLRYDLAISYARSYNVYTFIKKLNYLLFVRYAGGFLKAILQEKQRLSVYRRLKSPQWYGAHLMSFKEYFF